jgi:hypothetical protein
MRFLNGAQRRIYINVERFNIDDAAICANG